MLKGKIHRVRLTGADINYEGSIEIDSSLMEAAGIIPFEQVDIWNITNGERFSTYALSAPRASGTVAVNGAAARKVQPGDKVIITAFGWMSEKQAETRPACPARACQARSPSLDLTTTVFGHLLRTSESSPFRALLLLNSKIPVPRPLRQRNRLGPKSF